MMRLSISFVCIALSLFLLGGCSEHDNSAGIEIGNPGLAFKAGFSVDYSEVKQVSLKKSASANEPMLIDSLNLTLTEVRSFCSFYVGVSVDQELGLLLWPYEDTPTSTIPVSFAQSDMIDETFKNIDLQTEGRLKEIGVSFQVGRDNFIRGRIFNGKKYVPFEYALSNFQILSLRYHYSQIDVDDSVASLFVNFRVRRFIDDVDLSKAEADEDGIIHISNEKNIEVWNALNERFASSFQAMRYEVLYAKGNSDIGYVEDILNEVSNSFEGNLVSNGDFSLKNDDWILLTQLNGAADTTIVKEKDSNVMQVKVTRGSMYSYSVQLMHENVPVVANHKYKCQFTIWSDVKGQITARLGTYIRYETIGFQEHVQVGTKPQTVEIEFVPETTDPFTRFELNLGKSERTFWIKNVKISLVK